MIFKKLQSKLHRFLPLTIAIALTGIVIWHTALVFRYYRQSITASKTIKHFIQQVALEKLDTSKAEQVIATLKSDAVASSTMPAKFNNPFKTLEKVVEETATTTETVAQ